jgi:hypothetical protein
MTKIGFIAFIGFSYFFSGLRHDMYFPFSNSKNRMDYKEVILNSRRSRVIANCDNSANIARLPLVSTPKGAGLGYTWYKDSLIQFRFYNKVIRLKIKGNLTTSPIVFISLHDNEITGQQVVSSYIKSHNLAFIQIENHKQRLISFAYLGRSFVFDPNRIFSETGIRLSLKFYGNYSPVAAVKVKKFASLILSQLNAAKTIIAVHNNSNGNYSINSYLKRGNLFKNALRVHILPKSDPDDFFLTTSKQLFERLKAKNFNIVLQDNQHVFNDGSLSVYYRDKNKQYINIEARKGHFSKQTEMLHALLSVLQ